MIGDASGEQARWGANGEAASVSMDMKDAEAPDAAAGERSGGESAGAPGLRELLGIETCDVVLNNVAMEKLLHPVSLTLERGKVVLVTGPKIEKKKSGASVLLQIVSGRKQMHAASGAVTGEAFALGHKHKFDLLKTRTPMLLNKTTLYRKTTPAETLQAALVMDGQCDAAERVRALKLAEDEFGPMMQDGLLLKKGVHVGDKEVDTGGITRGQNLCCQSMREISPLDRRKLEFVAHFLQGRRPDTMTMVESKELVYTEMVKYLAFIRDVCTSSRRTSALVRIKALHGRFLHLCDTLVILSGPSVVYIGPPGAFRRHVDNVLLLPVPDAFSATEFIIDHTDKMLHPDCDLDAIEAKFWETSDAQSIAQEATARAAQLETLEPNDPQTFREGFELWWMQAIEVFWRTHRNYVRTPGLTTLRWLLYVTFAVMTGIIAMSPSALAASDRIWLLIAGFDFTVAASLFGMYALRLERKTLFRECQNRRLYLSAWHVGHFLGSVLGVLYISIVPGLLFFYLMQLDTFSRSWEAVAGFVATYYFMLLLCEALWTMVAFAIPQKKRSTVIASFFALAFVLGQGVFTKLANLPANRYVMFVTIFRPAMTSFFARQFAGVEPVYYLPQVWQADVDACQLHPTDSRNWTSPQVLGCLNVTVWNGKCPVEPANGLRWTGDEVLSCLQFKSNGVLAMELITILIIIFIRIITYLIVRWQIRRI